MPAFTWKMNIFQSISLETPKMCVEILRTGLFFQTIDLRGHMPSCLLWKNIMLSTSLETP